MLGHEHVQDQKQEQEFWNALASLRLWGKCEQPFLPLSRLRGKQEPFRVAWLLPAKLARQF